MIITYSLIHNLKFVLTNFEKLICHLCENIDTLLNVFSLKVMFSGVPGIDEPSNSRTSHQGCSIQIGVLKCFTKLTGKVTEHLRTTASKREMTEKRFAKGHLKNGKTVYQKNIVLARGLDQGLNIMILLQSSRFLLHVAFLCETAITDAEN